MSEMALAAAVEEGEKASQSVKMRSQLPMKSCRESARGGSVAMLDRCSNRAWRLVWTPGWFVVAGVLLAFWACLLREYRDVGFAVDTLVRNGAMAKSAGRHNLLGKHPMFL